jgi:hypothetical protein
MKPPGDYGRFIAIAAVTVGSILLVWLLVSAEVTDILTPSPDKIAEQLVQAISAERYEAVPDLLSEQIKDRVTEQDLQEISRNIKALHQGIEQVSSQKPQEQGGTATVPVEIQFQDGTKQTLVFPLEKEKHLWKVRSIDPLRLQGFRLFFELALHPLSAGHAEVSRDHKAPGG